MSDALQACAWVFALAFGIALCILLRRWGVATTQVRDLLHVGAGIWVLGWSGWHRWEVPVAITWSAALLTALVPMLSRRTSTAASFRDSVSGGDEGWAGLVLYTLSFAFLTTVGLRGQRLAAGAALWALCLGDGVGGAVGRRFGRHFFAAPGGKRKSFEGSAAVALAATLAAVLAAAWWREPVRLDRAVLLGAVAAVVEALSPRSTDNLLVPLAVFGTAALGGTTPITRGP